VELFAIKHLNFAYPEQAKNAISDFSLSVRPGEFLVVCGPSGCGKSTLLRQLKTVLAPHGRRSGQILFDGKNLDELSQREQAEKIGFVQQSPENQIVTDKVWHELAFGLESLGYDTPTIRRRVAEMASFFGIQTWFYKSVTELSGGQKQLLNLASVMVLQPKVLILDEPTSQLDPIAASDFLATLGKINRELGTTIILTEHRLEEAFSFARGGHGRRQTALQRNACRGGRGIKIQRERDVLGHAGRHADMGGDGFQGSLPHFCL
jgi:energy-coupling factor transporter ATP-binding protein EcfA2